MKRSIFNTYLFFERDLYNFYVSFDPEFLRKTLTHKNYLYGSSYPIRKQRKSKGNFIKSHQIVKFPVKKRMSKAKLNKMHIL